ncbi:MAG: sodium:solute symporter family protein [Dissulfurispiraceae bacterium]|jgi:SSS family solute:Na+ symporter|nr:sodium:solute symporter family protein [Dissulfurispiraceae bacterium]
MNYQILILVIGAYVLVTAYLGWLGYKKTNSAADYLVGGREIHPVLMSLAYGSTFISTSAIVGFGGAAAMFGMGLLWLTVLNIFIGIFIAFVVFGKPTRRIGAQLDAHTFPELLGRRFNSRFIQGFSGSVIAALMPLYAAAVMIGGARFLEVQIGISYDLALFIFSIVVLSYVFFGGLKGVVYTDALQGTLMFAGMIILLFATYSLVGGLSSHQALTDLASKVPEKLAAAGHQGWTSMPVFGSDMWWTLVSTIVMGVGIGVLAQPQLAVRFMTVKSGKELNRAVIPGGIFILMMTGVAFVVGALTNLYFWQTQSRISLAVVMDQATGKPNIDKIIPAFINSAMPDWFGYVFMLSLIAAAMSTLSGQFHAIGTSIGRDLYQQAIANGKHQDRTVPIAKFGIFVAFVITMLLCYKLAPGIVAIATALYFGMCAAVFLPAFVSALFWKSATKAGVITGMLSGFFSWGLWVLFFHEKESAALGLVKAVFGKASLVSGTTWAVVDPIIIALPISAIVTVAVSLSTKSYEANNKIK